MVLEVRLVSILGVWESVDRKGHKGALLQNKVTKTHFSFGKNKLGEDICSVLEKARDRKITLNEKTSWENKAGSHGGGVGDKH